MMDVSGMERAVRAFLDALGERFEGDDLERTPSRVARAWCEDLVSGYAVDPVADLTWTPVAPDGGPVIVRRIRFTSVCVHHLLPFFGYAHVAYLPNVRLAGLSKIGRVVDAHARRLQTQERLSEAVVTSLEAALEPRGVLALLEAEHTCMTCRGVRKEAGRMVTLASSGIYRQDAAARREVLDLFGAPRDETPHAG
jgi:GTP cyclohydrolase I